jgi:hypothetical protein
VTAFSFDKTIEAVFSSLDRLQFYLGKFHNAHEERKCQMSDGVMLGRELESDTNKAVGASSSFEISVGGLPPGESTAL